MFSETNDHHSPWKWIVPNFQSFLSLGNWRTTDYDDENQQRTDRSRFIRKLIAREEKMRQPSASYAWRNEFL